METLEIELAYIQELLDEEVVRVLHQYFEWHMLEDCSGNPPILSGVHP